MTRVAINGLGRIGRAILKILMDTEGLDLVAANDIGAADNIAYLLKYDTVYGRYEKAVEVAAGAGEQRERVRVVPGRPAPAFRATPAAAAHAARRQGSVR